MRKQRVNAIRNICKRVRQHGTHPGPSFDFACATPFDWAQDRLRMPGHAERRPKAGVEASPPRRGPAKQAGGLSPTRFFRDRRGVGTAIAAAIFTLMSLAGVALVGDHKHMTTNRDLLKGAANAATIAVMMELDGRSLSALTAGERSAVDATAQRYILANIKANVSQDTYDQAERTLQVTLKDTGPGLVDVDATADLGNIVFGSWLWAGVAKKTEVVSRTERVSTTTEVVLAIDATSSMTGKPTGYNSAKIDIVKQAALSLIDILTADDNNQTAFGLVPWHNRVQLNPAMRTRWTDRGWAVYPAERYYPLPYVRTDGQAVGLNHINGETHRLPAQPKPWLGCPDMRSLCATGNVNYIDPYVGCLNRYPAGTLPPGFSLALPSATPFTMAFYSDRLDRPQTQSTSYECRVFEAGEKKKQRFCYDESAVPEAHRARQLGEPYFLQSSAQSHCRSDWHEQHIMPLTTDIDAVKEAVRKLRVSGDNTYSTLGLVWGRRLLAHSWNDAWGGGTHPLRPAADVQKALVLLTDGVDNHIIEHQSTHRPRVCDEAKADGITVFTIAAMNTGSTGYAEFRDELEGCASKPEYAFVNNSTQEALEQAFRDIAAQLLRFRRVM